MSSESSSTSFETLKNESLSPTDNHITKEMLDTFLTELRTIRTELKEVKEKQASLEAKLNLPSDIKTHIFGKWRDVNNAKTYFSAKFPQDDMFIIKWNHRKSYCRYQLGSVKNHEDGTTTTIENNVIVTRETCQDGGGEEKWREEFRIENGRLVSVFIRPDEPNAKLTFERIGDPDPDSDSE